MEFVYKLKDDSPFKGTVKIKLMPRMARLEMVKGINFKINEEGKIESSSAEQISMIQKLDPIVKESVKELKIVYKKNKTEVKTLDELEFFKEGDSLVIELGILLLNGASLGEP